MQRPFFKLLMQILKLLLTLLILWMVFAKVKLRDLVSSLLSLPLWLLPVLGFMSFLRHWAQLRTWRHALQINPGYQYQPHEVRRSYLIGLPLNFAIPGGHANLGKILWVQNTSHLASALAFTTERGLQTWATIGFAAIAAAFYYDSTALWIRMLGLVVCLIWPLAAIPLIKKWDKSNAALPSFYKQAPRIAVLQIIAALIAFSQYWLLLNLHHAVSWLKTVELMSLTSFSNSIPITLGGLGLRESFAVHFLGSAGFEPAQAVSSTLSLFVIQDIIPSLIGLAVFLRKRGHKNAS